MEATSSYGYCIERKVLSRLYFPFSASEAILSCVLKFVQNLLNLDSDLDHEDNPAKRALLPNLDTLIRGLHDRFLFNKAAMRYDNVCNMLACFLLGYAACFKCSTYLWLPFIVNLI